MHGQNGPNSNRQHYGGVLHKQRGRHEVGPAVCPTLEKLDHVHQKASNSKGPTHSRLVKCGSRQAIQIRPDHPDGIVPPSRGVPGLMQQVAPASDLFATRFNNNLPLFATAVDALSPPREDLDAYAFPPTAIVGKVVEKLQDSP